MECVQTDNQANLYGGVRTNVSTDKAIKYYLANGATASKINMGIPLYGRAFEDTTGLGEPYNGVSATASLHLHNHVANLYMQVGPGTFEAGVYSYNVLPIAGATVYENTTDVSSYSFDASSGELVSYDTPDIVTLKAKYVLANGLAGSMFWDVSAQFTLAHLSGFVLTQYHSCRLIRSGRTRSLAPRPASTVLWTRPWYVFLCPCHTRANDSVLRLRQNHIDYPDSEWDNIANNMGQGSTTTTTSAGSTSTTTSAGSTTTTPTGTTTTTSATTTTTSGSGACATVSAWSATVRPLLYSPCHAVG